MTKWFLRDIAEPPRNTLLLCACRDWNTEGYQVCKWNGKEFFYYDQPNGMFDELVTAWSVVEELENDQNRIQKMEDRD